MKAMENRDYGLKYFSKLVIWYQTHLAPIVSRIIDWDKKFVNDWYFRNDCVIMKILKILHHKIWRHMHGNGFTAHYVI